MKKAIIHIVIFTLLFAFSSCGTPVSEYEAKNQAEQELKALLIEFLDYRNKHDVDGLLSLFRSDAEVIQGHGEDRYYATKTQARETWPEVLELYPKAKFTDPEMEVTDNQAVVRFDITTNGFRLKGTQHLVKENGKWLITKFTYED